MEESHSQLDDTSPGLLICRGENGRSAQERAGSAREGCLTIGSGVVHTTCAGKPQNGLDLHPYNLPGQDTET